MGIIRISSAAASTLATAIKSALDAGSGPGLIKIYAGTMPATVDTAIGAQTLLGTLTLSDPCGTVSGNTLTLAAITQDSAADDTGTASFARLLDSDMTPIMDVDISATGGGGALQLNTTSIVVGGPIAITAFTVTIG